jgi:predicted nuclease of restriction endonuclease-like (RecB) superfamily
MLDTSYVPVIESIKEQIRCAQHKAILNANKEMLILYWNIGKVINENSTWGSKFLNKLSNEISSEFPTAKGFSVRNLKNMVRFYREYPEIEIVQTLSAQITWSHNLEILRVESKEQRLWYINKTIENGWSVNVLAHQIDTNLYARQIEQKKVSNFPTILPSSQSELALETMKDPYVFDFIELKEDAKEKDLEEALIKNITKVLLEFGKGFAYVSHQYHLEVAGEDYYIDLLFYNIKLKCYVVIELKVGEFKPEYAGKLSFYLTAIDEQVKEKNDNPTIGLLLCRNKNNVIAEYTLRDMNKPMGVSEYRIKDYLPENLQNELPSIEELITIVKKEV